MTNFYIGFFKEIIDNLNNEYTDNYDYYRFGAVEQNLHVQKENRLKASLINLVDKILAKRNYRKLKQDSNKGYFEALNQLSYYFNSLEKFYTALSDEESKDLLVKLLAYKILGHKKVKLPLSTNRYWDGIKDIENISNHEDFIHIKFLNWKLSLIDLNKRNIPIKLYLTPVNTFREFMLKQYEYKSISNLIKAGKDDYVIDAGGCWGDTALYFSNEIGENGKVFTYEFIPSNLEILKKNIALNPALEKRITIIEKPVWEASGVDMYFRDNGPGSKVFLNNDGLYDGSVQSLSIDDLVTQNNIQKVDFIKMDIEGAEPFALNGAINTIKKFKPKLAIAIYHSMGDFTQIPAFLTSINCGYKFYLGHYTIHQEETILFASVD